MKIEILGSGCAKCNELTENAKQAVKQSGVDATIEKVTDMNEIMKKGVMFTPAIAVDGVVKSAGKVLRPEEIARLLK